ncbi:MAG: hypothetical protein WC551_07915 [Patescibacteria group bacterium]
MLLREIARLTISALLICLAGFLYWCGLTHPQEALQLGATNLASVIVGANLAYWLKSNGSSPRASPSQSD